MVVSAIAQNSALATVRLLKPKLQELRSPWSGRTGYWRAHFESINSALGFRVMNDPGWPEAAWQAELSKLVLARYAAIPRLGRKNRADFDFDHKRFR